MTEMVEAKPAVSTYWLLRIVLGSLLGAVLIGVLFAVVAQYLNIIILYPVLMGAFGGMFVAFGALRLKVEKRLPLFVAGVLLGLLIYGVYRYTDYLLFVRKVNEDSEKPVSMTFDQYLRLTAAVGMEVGSLTKTSEKPIELDQTLTWGLWGVELLSATLCGGYFALRLRKRYEGFFEKYISKSPQL